MRFLFTVLIVSILNSISYSQSYKDELFTSYFQRTGPGWIASDGAVSLALPDGRTLWMMGDSHIDQTVDEDGEIPCLFNTRNSILVQDANDRNDIGTLYDRMGTNVYERQIVKMPGVERATYWPASGVVKGDTAYTYWTRFDYDTSAVWNLGLKGTVIAKIKLPELYVTDVQLIPYPEVEFGTAFVKSEEDGYYYIYGKKLDWIVFRPILARCTFDNLEGPWEFYDGSDWSSNPDDVAYISPEVAPEYSVFYYNDKYHMFYQESGYLQCGWGRDMYIYSSSSPTGPFENPILVYTMEDMFLDTFPLTYNAQAHPQFIENDELLISYLVNNVCPSVCAADPFNARYNPDMYRPQFARVPLALFTTTSNEENDNPQSISISPNPSSGIYRIHTKDNSQLKYLIRDVNGKLIGQGSNKTLNLQNFKAGVYFVELQMSSGLTEHHKLLKF